MYPKEENNKIIKLSKLANNHLTAKKDSIPKKHIDNVFTNTKSLFNSSKNKSNATSPQITISNRKPPLSKINGFINKKSKLPFKI